MFDAIFISHPADNEFAELFFYWSLNDTKCSLGVKQYVWWFSIRDLRGCCNQSD